MKEASVDPKKWKLLIQHFLPIALFLSLAVICSSEAIARRPKGSALALAKLRASKKTRRLRDKTRAKNKFDRTASIVRIRNQTWDPEISHRLALLVQEKLEDMGLRVKDYRAVRAIIEGRDFTHFRSSSALKRLGKRHLSANLLVFLTVEKCIVSSFRDEYRSLLSSGQIRLPEKEFVELQIKASLFDAGQGKLRFSRRDRQFVAFSSGNSGRIRQQVFERCISQCVSNLFCNLGKDERQS